MRGSGLWSGLQQTAVAWEVDYVGVDVWDGVQQAKACAGAWEVDTWEWVCGMESAAEGWGVGSGCVRSGSMG
jgi:hypothetical protein